MAGNSHSNIIIRRQGREDGLQMNPPVGLNHCTNLPTCSAVLQMKMLCLTKRPRVLTKAHLRLPFYIQQCPFFQRALQGGPKPSQRRIGLNQGMLVAHCIDRVAATWVKGGGIGTLHVCTIQSILKPWKTGDLPKDGNKQRLSEWLESAESHGQQLQRGGSPRYLREVI